MKEFIPKEKNVAMYIVAYFSLSLCLEINLFITIICNLILYILFLIVSACFSHNYFYFLDIIFPTGLR